MPSSLTIQHILSHRYTLLGSVTSLRPILVLNILLAGISTLVEHNPAAAAAAGAVHNNSPWYLLCFDAV
jgi:hypothetical protein